MHGDDRRITDRWTSCRGRRLGLEVLERRDLLTVGDFLFELTNGGDQAQASAEFGFATAAEGNLLIVGAPTADAKGLASVGEAYIFDATTGDLLVTLHNPVPQSGDRFGFAVDISGQRAVVGNHTNDLGATDAGIVYVFDAVSGDLLHAISNPTPAAFDYFGYSVAIDGDVIVAGAFLDDTAVVDGGAAYVINAVTGVVEHTLTRDMAAANDYTGFSVDVTGNVAVVSASRANTFEISDGEVLLFDTVTGDLISTIVNPTPANFEYFGRAISAQPGRLLVSAYRDNQGAVDSGVAYLFDVEAGGILQTFVNPSPGVGDNFGWSIDLNGDHILIGAYRDDLGARDSGMAYQFDAVSGDLIHTLANPTPGELDYFGSTVSMASDWAIVGSYWDDTEAFDAGRVYLFNSASGQLARELDSQAKSSFDYFGFDVSVTDEKLAVGVYLDDTFGTDAGVVRIFESSTGTLQRVIPNPFPAPFDSFGYAVSLSENVLAVGAYSDDTGNIVDSGTVYLFDANSGDLLHTIRSPEPKAGDYFGHSVSLAGNRLAVGAYRADQSTAADTGSVYVYDATSGALLHEISHPALQPFDYFGYSVSLSTGGLLAVGAPFDDAAGGNAGAAYVFDADTGSHLSTLSASLPQAFDQFGWSVAILENRVLVGAPQRDEGATNGGAAYLFESVSGMSIAELLNPAPENNSFFGHDVALTDDLAAVAAYGANVNATQSGAAYLFEATSGLFRAPIISPAPAGTNYFGYSLAMSDSYLVVGAPLVDGLSADRGAAYLYDAGIPFDPPPIAQAGGPYTASEGQSIQLDGSGSSDAPNAVETLVFEWDLDYDGITFDVEETGIAPVVLFGDDVPLRTIALRVTDVANQSSLDQALLEVLNLAPDLTVDSSTVELSPAGTATNSGTVEDAGDDEILLSASLGTVTDNADGTWSWTYDDVDGTLTQMVVIRATDSDGAISEVSFELVAATILAESPFVAADEGTAIVNSGHYLLPASGQTVGLTTSIGEVVDQGDGTWDWTWEASDGPDDSQDVTITATYSDGLVGTVTFAAQVRNVAPQLSVDQPTVILSPGGTVSNTGTVADLGVDEVTLATTLGTIVDNLDGTWFWSYDDLGGTLTQEITITAMDSDGATAEAFFSLQAQKVIANSGSTLVNEGERIENSGRYVSPPEGGTVTLTSSIGEVIDHDDGVWDWAWDTTDGPDDSQQVTITATYSDGQVGEVSFQADVLNVAPSANLTHEVVDVLIGAAAVNEVTVVDPGDDEVTVMASAGEVVDGGNGVWFWSLPTSTEQDSQTILLTISDSDGDSSEISFDVVVSRILADESFVTVDEGATANLTGVYALPAPDETVALSASLGDVVDLGEGSWTWNWTAGDGPDTSQSIEITANYSGGASSVASFFVDVINLAPNLALDQAAVVVDQGGTATNSGTVMDDGGDLVALSASIGEITDNSDGTWSWFYMAISGDAGHTVTITALDDDGAESFVTFELSINNLAPQLTVDADAIQVVRGRVATNSGTFSDFGGGNVTLAASIGEIIDQQDGTWLWSLHTRNETSQSITISATDADGAVETISFDLLIIPRWNYGIELDFFDRHMS